MNKVTVKLNLEESDPHLGDLFLNEKDNSVYVLTYVKGVYAAIDIATGQKWNEEVSIAQAVRSLTPLGKDLKITISE